MSTPIYRSIIEHPSFLPRGKARGLALRIRVNEGVPRRLELETDDLEAPLVKLLEQTRIACAACGKACPAFRRHKNKAGRLAKTVATLAVGSCCPFETNLGCSRGNHARDAVTRLITALRAARIRFPGYSHAKWLRADGEEWLSTDGEDLEAV